MTLRIPLEIVAPMLDRMTHKHEREDIVRRMGDADLIDIQALASYRQSQSSAKVSHSLPVGKKPVLPPEAKAAFDAARERRQQWRDGAYAELVQLAADDPDVLLRQEDRVEEVLHNAGKSVDDLSNDMDAVTRARSKAALQEASDRARDEQIHARLEDLRTKATFAACHSAARPPSSDYLPPSSCVRK